VTLKDAYGKRYAAAFPRWCGLLLFIKRFCDRFLRSIMITGSLVSRLFTLSYLDDYYTGIDLKPGYRTSTRLRFGMDGFEMVFVLVQGEQHDTLHESATTCT
jgi:hypothetical protein